MYACVQEKKNWQKRNDFTVIEKMCGSQIFVIRMHAIFAFEITIWHWLVGRPRIPLATDVRIVQTETETHNSTTDEENRLLLLICNLFIILIIWADAVADRAPRAKHRSTLLLCFNLCAFQQNICSLCATECMPNVRAAAIRCSFAALQRHLDGISTR